MKSQFYYATVVLMSAALFAGCNSVKSQNAQKASATSGPETVHTDGARRISIAEVRTMMEKNEVFIVDVRNQASWDAGHIPGAVLIPGSEILNHVNELPKDKLIVMYCSCANEHTAAVAVNSLKTKNITNAAALLGGFTQWQKENLPIDKKKTVQVN